MKRFSQYFCMLLLSLVAFACTQNQGTPEKTAENFTVALFKGNTDELFTLLYLDDEVKQQDNVEKVMKGKIDMLVQESKKSADNKGGLKAVITEPAIYNKDKTKATVVVIATFKNGEINKQNLDLALDDGKWLVFLK